MILLNTDAAGAIKLSRWLREQGYEHDEDYVWYQQSRTRQVVFICKDPAVETLLTLKYHEQSPT